MQSITMETFKSALSVVPQFREYLTKIDEIPIDDSLVLQMKEISQERYRQWMRLTKGTMFLYPTDVVSCLGLFSAVGNMKHLDAFIEAQVQIKNPNLMWRVEASCFHDPLQGVCAFCGIIRVFFLTI